MDYPPALCVFSGGKPPRPRLATGRAAREDDVDIDVDERIGVGLRCRERRLEDGSRNGLGGERRPRRSEGRQHDADQQRQVCEAVKHDNDELQRKWTKEVVAACLGKQLVYRLDQPRNIDMHCIPQDAMVDQVVAVDEMVSCARDVLPGNINAALLELVRQASDSLADNFNASFESRRRLPIHQEGVERVGVTQCLGFFGCVANLRERDSRITTAHDSS